MSLSQNNKEETLLILKTCASDLSDKNTRDILFAVLSGTKLTNQQKL